MKVINFGSLNIDHIYQVDHVVNPEETLSVSKAYHYAGGKGLNQSIAISRSGGTVMHCGCVGMGDGGYLLDILDKNGVNTSLVRKKEANTGTAFIQVTADGTRSIIECGGANLTMTDDHIDFALAQIHKGDVLLVQNEVNDVPKIIEKGLRAGARIALNASPYSDGLKKIPVREISFLFLNRSEASQFTGINPNDIEDMIPALRSMFPNAEIVMTMGMKGSMLITAEDEIYQGIYEVETKDKTAASDAFVGFYLGTRMSGATKKDAIMMAAKAASICASRNGAASSIPMIEECWGL